MKTLTQRLTVLIFLLNSFAGANFCIQQPQTSPQVQSEWTRVLARGEEFSVLLPEVPAMSSKSRAGKTDGERYGGRVYGAYGDGIVYVIISENNPKQAEKIETFVAEFKATLPRHSLGSPQVIFDREIILNNFHGKRYRVKFYNGINGIVDFYMTNNHVYIVEVMGGDESSPLIQQFFKSFSLDENAFVNEKARLKEAHLSASDTGPSQPKPITTQAAEQIYSRKEVTQSAIAVSKPEPSYTAEARQNQLRGTVVLRAVLSSSGKVSDIKVVKGLQHGLTNKAVEAAGKLKFIPAVKDGKFVSQSIQFEYSFNLY